MLGNTGLFATGQVAGRVEYQKRHAEAAHVVFVHVVGAFGTGMVGRQYEDCVFIPWLLAGRVEKSAKRIVCVAYALVQWINPFILQYVAVFVGYFERMV